MHSTKVMPLFLRQIWTLIVKNLLVTLVRPYVTTLLRALVLPVAFIVFMYVTITRWQTNSFMDSGNSLLMIDAGAMRVKCLSSRLNLESENP